MLWRTLYEEYEIEVIENKAYIEGSLFMGHEIIKNLKYIFFKVEIVWDEDFLKTTQF